MGPIISFCPTIFTGKILWDISGQSWRDRTTNLNIVGEGRMNMSEKFYFNENDFNTIPRPGIYYCCISDVRFRTSAQGNNMLQVTFTLEDASESSLQVNDYFVLQEVSPLGIKTARRRLVQLYRACGIYPKDGDPIDPNILLNKILEITLDYDFWQGQHRCRIVAYRAPKHLKMNFNESQTPSTKAATNICKSNR